MKIEIKGLAALQKNLKAMQQRAKSLHGEHQVSLAELFPADFMRRQTDFSSMGELVDACGFGVKTFEDFENIPDAERNDFISKRTRFTNWQEMQETAAGEYFAKKLKL